MTEKQWIKIHSGLTNDPKHRERMGNRVWLFMWLVDHADYEAGIVGGYTDAWAAHELDMNPRTVERQRQELEAADYIVCHQGFQCQNIRIMRWRNPKKVTPPQINVPGDASTWYENLRTHPHRNFRTPTYDSYSQESQGEFSECHPAVMALLERHWAFMGGAIQAETYCELYEAYGAAAFEEGLIAVVAAGGGRKMNKSYLRTVLTNKRGEDNSITDWERAQLSQIGVDL